MLGAPPQCDEILRFDDCQNFLKAGIVMADRVGTVSKTYAEELRYPYYAHGLSEILASRGEAFSGIVNGMTETTFEPQGTLTRAEFATMLYRIAGTPAAEAESTYSDVKTGDWYYNAVVWATEAGVVNGMGDGTFAPNDNITRQEMATMLYRLAKAEKVEEDKLASFPDAASVADWAKDAMNWAVSTEIVNGSTHDDKVNYLDPTATALRCQAAAVACRYLALSK